MLAVVLLATPAFAGKEKDTKTIGFGDSIVVKVKIDGTTNVMYDVKVDSGPNVNVWWLEQVDYDKYSANQPFEYFILYSNEDVGSVKEDFSWSQDGNHYVVIDSMGIAGLDENATVSYTVEWEKASAADWIMNIGICLAIVIVIVIVGFFFRRSRSKPAEAPPMAMQQPGQPDEYTADIPPMPTDVPPSDQGPGYVPPEPSHYPPQGEPPGYDPGPPRQDPPQY
ncbi:MAG: hypothetical protein JSW25_08630 [Thermoplasmata archaeon]|nr:MAG: hypothetical protein JSW25_08630 [Thermoplasmata archaeon]